MDDELIKVNNTNFSLRKILEEDGWNIYCKASEKVKDLTKLMVKMDLSAMELGFARLDQKVKDLDDMRTSSKKRG